MKAWRTKFDFSDMGGFFRWSRPTKTGKVLHVGVDANSASNIICKACAAIDYLKTTIHK